MNKTYQFVFRTYNVIPAQAGIQRVAPVSVFALLDLRVRGDDGNLFSFREVGGVN